MYVVYISRRNQLIEIGDFESIRANSCYNGRSYIFVASLIYDADLSRFKAKVAEEMRKNEWMRKHPIKIKQIAPRARGEGVSKKKGIRTRWSRSEIEAMNWARKVDTYNNSTDELLRNLREYGI